MVFKTDGNPQDIGLGILENVKTWKCCLNQVVLIKTYLHWDTSKVLNMRKCLKDQLSTMVDALDWDDGFGTLVQILLKCLENQFLIKIFLVGIFQISTT